MSCVLEYNPRPPLPTTSMLLPQPAEKPVVLSAEQKPPEISPMKELFGETILTKHGEISTDQVAHTNPSYISNLSLHILMY